MNGVESSPEISKEIIKNHALGPLLNQPRSTNEDYEAVQLSPWRNNDVNEGACKDPKDFAVSDDAVDLDDEDVGGGLWLNLRLKEMPPVQIDAEDALGEQCGKLLSYQYKYALPKVGHAEVPEKFFDTENNQLRHNQCSYDESDFLRHRKFSPHFHELIRPVSTEHRQHAKRKHRSSQKADVKLEDVAHDKVDIELGETEHGSHKALKISKKIKRLPQIKESRELFNGELTDDQQARSAKDKKDHLSRSKRKSVPGRHDKRLRHHHHRHRHRGLTQQDTLESRIRTGLQTLHEERKALRSITCDLEAEDSLRVPDLADISNHRLEHFKASRRLSTSRHQRSGMTTHISHGSMSVNKPHVKIEMNESQIALAPKEGFVELEELTTGENNELQWKEKARWIKFEEDVEKNERWGKPHVASLSFQSLLELRHGIERGSVLLNLDCYDLPTIFESVVENMIITDQISDIYRDRLIGVLLSKHCHHHQQRSNLHRRLSFTSLSFTDLRQADDAAHGPAAPDRAALSDGEAPFSQSTSPLLAQGLQASRSKPSFLRSQSETSTLSARKLLRQSSSGSTVVHLSQAGSFSRASGSALAKAVTDNGELATLDECGSESDEDKKFGVTFGPVVAEPLGEFKTVSDVKERIPLGAEATSVLVATLAELDRPAMAFVRLAKGCFLGNLTEVTIPVRFLFIIMGPPSSHDYYEIGRSIATLMSDKIFHDLAYAAKSRDDILAAINSFLDDSIVLAPGDWDRHLLLPLLQAEIMDKKKQRIRLLKEKAAMERPADDDPLERTGILFGGLARDFRRKVAFLKSDFTDGLNWRCLVAVIFIFFASLAPTITFGGLLSKKTENWLGVIETLIATSICGMLFSLLAGQPLIVIGTTGPILVFEQATYQLCKYFQIEFLAWRFWIGVWVMIILWSIVAFEGCYLVENFTRFTEEVFSVLISVLFINEAVYYVILIFKEHPLKQPELILELGANNKSLASSISMMLNTTLTSPRPGVSPIGSITNQPNTALITVLLVLGTFYVAFYLRKLRHSHFFSSRARRVVSDFGVPIAMIVMAFIDFLIVDVYTPKIKMPSGFMPTRKERSYFIVNPLGIRERLHVGWMCFAILPAILVSILLFMETELTGVLINKKRNKLKKGGGYNLDLMVMGLLTMISSAMGLPWMCAATVCSVQHANALAITSRTHAPGERPYLVEIKEQRLTNFLIHLLMGGCVFGSAVIKQIPIAVCFGIFLYLGVSSLSGIQLVEQLELLFVPTKYYPNHKYIRCVRSSKLMLYTVIQCGCLVVLFAVKLSPVAPLFPFIIICMVGVRKAIERFFTEEELEDLDNEEDEEFDELDEYATSCMPI